MISKTKNSVKPSSIIEFESQRACLSPPATVNSTNQIILQRITSLATRTMIHHPHELIGRLGCEHIIAKVREKLWIPQIRKVVCSFLSQCIVCKNFHAKPMTQQIAPPSSEWTFLYPCTSSLEGVQ